MPATAREGLRGREAIWTVGARDTVLQALAALHDRTACSVANRMLNRASELDRIPLRTMTDVAEREGEALLAEQGAWARRVLSHHGWDPETLLPTPAAELAPGVSALDGASYAPPAGEDHARRVKDAIEVFNARRDDERERIPEGSEKALATEPDPGSAVVLSLDGVNSKRQKDTRPKRAEGPTFVRDDRDGPIDYSRPPERKGRPRVETAVAHVECDGREYVLTAESMFAVCGLAIALMLEQGLLIGRRLVVITDGGVDIRACARDLLSFCNPTVILDWFHLLKRCRELLSMALKGGKRNFGMQYEVKRRLFRMLWAGNVRAAIEYLESLEEDKVKCQSRLEELVRYLTAREPQIACYAVRRALGLRTSSNKVEKANDLVVSSRQKHGGMSWSRQGSWSAAAVRALYLDGESRTWLTGGSRPRCLRKEYGSLFDPPRPDSLPTAA